MQLDIKHKISNVYNCLETLIPPIAKWFGKDYELMSLDTWGFRYEPWMIKDSSDLFSKSFDSGKYSRFDYLQKYHGILLHNIEKPSYEDLIDTINREIKSNRPIIIEYDTYEAPWAYEWYKKRHSWHCILIIGFDSGGIYITDSFVGEKITYLSYDDFFVGYNNCILCSTTENYTKDITWNELLWLSICDEDRFTGTENAFKLLRDFSSDFANRISLTEEMKGHEEIPSGAPIIANIRDIGIKRKQYSLALSYLASKYCVPELEVMSKRFIDVSVQWSSVFGMLLKAYYLNNDLKLLKRIENKINELAVIEEATCKDIFHVQDLSTKSVVISDAWPVMPISVSLCTFIDLSNYTNNKGFGYDLDPGNSSEFSDGGRYIYINDTASFNAISIGGMHFKLAGITDFYDNISCRDQVIKKGLTAQTYMMILGCAEFGSYSDVIKIEYEDGKIEDIKIGVTYIVSEITDFNESIFTIGQYVRKRINEVEFLHKPANLFAQYYAVNKDKAIREIRLPYCPNIHIFAITFSK